MKILTDYGFKNPIVDDIGYIKYVKGGNKMETIRESAKKFESKKTKVISDLKEVNTELNLIPKHGVKKDGVEFSYNVIVIDEVEYRVPDSVIEQLKTLIEEKPGMTMFKVKKKGEGLNTEYQVIALD